MVDQDQTSTNQTEEKNKKINFNTTPDKVARSKQSLVYGNFDKDDQFFQSSFNSDDYEEMLDMYYTDGKIAQAVDLPVHMALGSLKDYNHPNKEIQEFIQENIFSSKLNLHNIVFNILSSRWTGVSVSYVETDIIDNKLVIRDIFTIDPQKYVPSNGIGTKKVVFETEDGEVAIKRDNLIIHTANKRFSDPYGNSVLFTIKKFFDNKTGAETAWKVFLQKFGVPYIMGWLNDDAKKPDQELFLSSLYNMSVGAVTVSSRYFDPETKQPNREIQILETQKGTADFKEFLARQDRDILTALGVSSILFNSDESGSYSLGAVHYKIFMKLVHQVQLYIKEIVLHKMILPLIAYNFGDTNPGELTFNVLEPREFLEVARGFKNLFDAGIIDPNDPADVMEAKRNTGLISVDGGTASKWVSGENKDKKKSNTKEKENVETEEPVDEEEQEEDGGDDNA
jgi:phage gp29-like protein